MNPIGVGFVRLDFEFHDTRGLVGMDGLDDLLRLLHIRMRDVGDDEFHTIHCNDD